MTDDSSPSRRRATRQPSGKSRCPMCGAATQHESRPFCSRRCADADLGRWFSGAYRVPTDETPFDPFNPLAGEDDDDPIGRA